MEKWIEYKWLLANNYTRYPSIFSQPIIRSLNKMDVRYYATYFIYFLKHKEMKVNLSFLIWFEKYH